MAEATTPKKRGRPPKNRLDYNVNLVSLDDDINKEHKFPISAMGSGADLPYRRGLPESDSDESLIMYMITTLSDKIKSIFEIYRDKGQQIAVMNFDASGVSFIYEDKDKTDTNMFTAKLFSDRFGAYFLRHKISINVGVEMIYLIFKLLPKDYPIVMTIYKEGIQYMLGINATHKCKKKDFNMDITINENIDFRFEQYSNAQYDYIVMLNSEDFQNEYKDIKSLSIDIFEIVCMQKKIIFQGHLDKFNHSTEITEDEATKSILYCKRNPDEKLIICSAFPTDNFTKYTKCAIFSKNVKVYFSNTEPLILEYTAPGAVFQAFINQIRQKEL